MAADNTILVLLVDMFHLYYLCYPNCMPQKKQVLGPPKRVLDLHPYKPWKMNGWNLRITPLEEKKLSFQNHHLVGG